MKTHDRPHKCPDNACRYHIDGFSAEKDRDRHFHDIHDKNAPKRHCEYNCGYSSSRESNVKQHMEKAHGYVYVRTKTMQSKQSPVATKPKRSAVTKAQKTPRRMTTQTILPISTPSLPSNLSSPRFGIDPDLDTLSPATMQAEQSPHVEFTDNFFPPLSAVHLTPVSHGIPPEFITRNDSPLGIAPYQTPFTFQNPSSAVEAINGQQKNHNHSGSGGDQLYTVPRNDPALVDSPLANSPESEFAETFLRDAPVWVWNQSPSMAIDPGLPVVQHNLYDPSRDRFPSE